MAIVLSEFQIQAIKSIEDGYHTLITAHTGSGKTLPAEYAIKYFTERGKKVIYTSPIKALSNQKYAEFTKKFPDLQIGILTGDNKHNPGANVLIMTTEILQNNLFKTNKNAYLEIDMNIETELGCVIFDEVHYIDDHDRGTVWEQCIIMLPDHIQIVMLSATIGEKEKFARWIENIKHNKVTICSTDKRVVPLSFYTYMVVPNKVITPMPPLMKATFEQKSGVLDVIDKNIDIVVDKNRRCLHYLKNNDISISRKFVLNELCNTLREKEMFPALFFVFSRKQVQEMANEIHVSLFDENEKDYMVEPICRQLLVSRVKNWKEYMALPEYQQYVNLLERGIGIHHAGMLPIFREMIEILYDQKYIRVLFATETFAIGLNMPTKTVCFTSLFKHDGNQLRQLYSHEFIQMAGRAGRRNIDTIGHVIMMTNLYTMLDSTQYHKLLHSSPKILKSKFKINYTLLLHYLNNYSLADCSSLIEKSLMNQDIINEIKLCNEKVKDLSVELSQQNALVTNESACIMYMDLNKDYVLAKNKIRKQLSNQITLIETEVRDIKNQVAVINKLKDIKKEIDVQQTNKVYAERYITSQVQSIYTILSNNNYLNETLTPKGVMACYIHEIHPLIFCDAYEKYDGFKNYNAIDIFCLLSCLYDIKVTDELKDLSPSFLKDELKFMNDRIYYYYDEETKYLLTNTEQSLNYDMMTYIKIWMESCDDEISSIQLIQRMKVEKKWFTGDFIKCCLKLVNMAKEIESCNNLELIEKMKEGSNKLLKFICSNESLYLV